MVRYENDGRVTVVADKDNDKPLNSPNDIVVHPDGGIWFTDPPYGILGNYEGFQATPELKEAVYRVDPHTAKVEMVKLGSCAYVRGALPARTKLITSRVIDMTLDGVTSERSVPKPFA